MLSSQEFPVPSSLYKAWGQTAMDARDEKIRKIKYLKCGLSSQSTSPVQSVSAYKMTIKIIL